MNSQHLFFLRGKPLWTLFMSSGLRRAFRDIGGDLSPAMVAPDCPHPPLQGNAKEVVAWSVAATTIPTGPWRPSEPRWEERGRR